MNFLCLAYYDAQATASVPKSEVASVVKQCRPHDEALRATGKLVLQAALGATSDARVVRPGAGRKDRFTDGPFSEAKDQVGGFAIVDVADLDEAIAIAAGHPATRIGQVEIRPVLEA